MGRKTGDLTVTLGTDTQPLEKGLAEGEKIYNQTAKRLGRLQQVQQLDMQGLLMNIDTKTADGYSKFMQESLAGVSRQIDTQQKKVDTLSARLASATRIAPGSDTESRASLALAQSTLGLNKLLKERAVIEAGIVGTKERSIQQELAKVALIQKTNQSESESRTGKLLAENGNQTDIYRSKLLGLGQEVILQRQKVDLLNKGYQEAVRVHGAASSEALRYKDAINQTTTSMYSNAKKIKDISEETAKSGLHLTGAFKQAAFMAATTGILALGAAMAYTGKESLKLAINAIESENLFSVATGKSQEQIRAWSENTSKALGLNAFQLRKDSGTWFMMFSSMGLGAEKASELSIGLTQLANDMSSLYNISVEDAFLKLRSGITGELEPLRRLGILTDVNTVNNTAWRLGIAQTGAELTQQQKILARYMTIREQTTVAEGDLASTMQDPANMARRLTAQTQELEIQIGRNLIPVYKYLLEILLKVTAKQGEAGDSITQFLSKMGAFVTTGATAGLMLGGPKGAAVGALAGGAVGIGNTLYDMAKMSKQYQLDQIKVYNASTNSYTSYTDRLLEYQKEYNKDFMDAEDKRLESYMKANGSAKGFVSATPGKIEDYVAREKFKRETDPEYDRIKTDREARVNAAMRASELARQAELEQQQALERQKMQVNLLKADNKNFESNMMSIQVQAQEFRKNKLGEKDIQEFVDKAKLNSIATVVKAEQEAAATYASVFDSDFNKKVLDVQSKVVSLRGAGGSDASVNQLIIAEKEKMVREVVKIEHTMADRIAEIDGNSLQGRMRSINEQAEAYRRAGAAENEITRWKYKERAQMEKDAARSSPYYSGFYKAFREKGGSSDAIREAIAEAEKDLAAQKQAEDMAKSYLPRIGDPNTAAEDSIGKRIPKIEAEFAGVDWNRLGKTSADMFFGPWAERVKELGANFSTLGNPGGYTGKKQEGPDMSGTYRGAGEQRVQFDSKGNYVNVTVPVSIDGQQVGEAAARILLPPVQAALQGSNTSFGGNR